MSKIKIQGHRDTPHNEMFIKDIDKVNKKLEFTSEPSEAYERDSGFYVDAEIDFLKFHFEEEYPEVKYAIAYGW